jgi:cytochrome c oxidase subunit 1
MIGIVVGAAVLVITLINLYMPSFTIDPLLAKNLIYFFGHVFVNASIYMAVIGVYEILPTYTGRKWKTSRVFAIAWSCVLLMVMAVYPHHLMQDIAMPGWLLVMGQIVSFGNALPLLGVTAFSMLVYLHRSGIKWDLASALLVIGVLGWSLGAVPAIVDATITVNRVMHNTMWVPGHFHTYLLLGEVAMSLGFMAWLTKQDGNSVFAPMEKAALGTYVFGVLGFTTMFLISGAASVPRRWAVHFPEWIAQDRIATLFAAILIGAFIVLITLYAARLLRPSKA